MAFLGVMGVHCTMCIVLCSHRLILNEDLDICIQVRQMNFFPSYSEKKCCSAITVANLLMYTRWNPVCVNGWDGTGDPFDFAKRRDFLFTALMI